MAMLVVAIFIGVVIFATSNMEKSKPVQQQDSSLPYYPGSSGSNYNYDANDNANSNTGFQTAISNSNYVLPQPVQDAHEDAYEEGESLGDEDRRNGIRTHVGDSYNGYDDYYYYDDGYEFWRK